MAEIARWDFIDETKAKARAIAKKRREQWRTRSERLASAGKIKVAPAWILAPGSTVTPPIEKEPIATLQTAPISD